MKNDTQKRIELIMELTRFITKIETVGISVESIGVPELKELWDALEEAVDDSITPVIEYLKDTDE